MENTEKLKRVVAVFKEELEELEGRLLISTSRNERIKINNRKAEVLTSIGNFNKYIKRLELSEKVKKYENSGRNT